MPLPEAGGSHRAALDHVVINVLTDMDQAAGLFADLGFTLTERGYHSLGSINHLAMFGTDYLELVGVELGADPVRREIADGSIGLDGLVFATDDASGLRDRLLRERIPARAPQAFSRPVRLGSVEERAEFVTVRIDPEYVRGGRIYFCEHKTPHLVWRPEWQAHPNSTLGVGRLTIVVPDPLQEARRYGVLLGSSVRTLDASESEIRLGAFDLVLCSLDRYRDRYGTFGCSTSREPQPESAPGVAFIGALQLRVASLSQARTCVRRASERRGVEFDDAASMLVVSARSAYDSVIEFV
jgi:hypothetical protein